ncbi:MAG: helix-turn-helix domain-containing protein [Alphaproteobacteria bacterium]
MGEILDRMHCIWKGWFMPVDNLPEICTPEEVAKYLRVDASVIKKLCRNGELEHFKPTPKKIRIPRIKIEEYQERCLKETKESISTSERTEAAGRFENSFRESVSDTQLALAALKMQKRNWQKS